MPSDRLNMKDWMRERWDEVEDAAGAAGRGFYGVRPREAAPAARPKAVRALGPVIETRDGIPVPKGPPIRRGPGQISDEEIANIIFNETRALSGPGIDEARRNIAHAVINGAEAGGKRPKSAPTRAEIPEVEREIYHSAVNAVAGARYERSKDSIPRMAAFTSTSGRTVRRGRGGGTIRFAHKKAPSRTATRMETCPIGTASMRIPIRMTTDVVGVRRACCGGHVRAARR